MIYNLFYFQLKQQHKNEYWNLVFSIWFLVTSWANEKDTKKAKILFTLLLSLDIYCDFWKNFKTPQ